MDVATTLAAAAGVEVELRTAHTPPLRWTPDDGDNAPSGASSPSGRGWSPSRAFMRWLRPEVTVVTGFGTLRKAPYGASGVSSWPVVPVVASLVLLVVLALAGVGLVTVGRRIAR